MGVIKYITNKLISFLLFAMALATLFSFHSTISNLIAVIFAIAGIYFWKHSPF